MTMPATDLLIGSSTTRHLRRCLSMLRGPHLALLVRGDRATEVTSGITPAILAGDTAISGRRWQRVYIACNDYRQDAYAPVIAAAHTLDAAEWWGVLPNLDLIPLSPPVVFIRRWRMLLQPLLAVLLYALYLPLFLPVLIVAYACSWFGRFGEPDFTWTAHEPQSGGER